MILFANDDTTTLAGPVTAIATTISVVSSAKFPVLSGTNTFNATLQDAATGLFKEIISVTNVTGTTWTVVRAQEGTTALSWNLGDLVQGYVTAGALTVMLQSSQLGVANGVATLDGTGHIPITQLPPSIQGAMSYQGAWNASTNTPTLVSSTGTKGYYYQVSVAGSTTLDGINVWNVGDVVTFNGTVWEKIDGVTSEVLSVAGRTGVVVLSVSDVAGAAPLASPSFTGTVTAPTFSGILTGTATSANNITLGAAGQLPFQTAPGATGFTAAGTSGQVLTSTGTTAPAWVAQSTLSVGSATTATSATNLTLGAAGQLPFQTAPGATGFTAAGTSGQVLTSTGTTAPAWVAQSTLSVGSATTATSATNLTLGAAGQLPFQTAPGATGFTAAGTSGQVLTSTGTTAPAWVAQSTLSVGTAASTPWTGLTSVPTAITSYAETMDQAVATTSSPAFVSVATDGVTIGAIPAARIKGYYGLLDTIGYVGNIATITVGTTPSGIAYCPTNNSIYVANQGAGTVSVIDSATNVVSTTVTVGTSPQYVAYCPTNNSIYVTNYGSGTVSVIDSATNVVSTTVTVGTNPNDVAYCPTNNSIYVTNYGSGTVSVINSATNVVSTTVTVGTNPNDVAYCPSVDRTYVTNQGSNNVSVLT